MTPREINEAMAELEGRYRPHTPEELAKLMAEWEAEEPHPHAGLTHPGKGIGAVDNYTGNLNPVHRVEGAVIEPHNTDSYATRLVSIVGRDWQAAGKQIGLFSTTNWLYACAHATAHQRCEAILRTLGKWKE